RHTSGDPEREVQVGEAVAASHSKRPHTGTGDNALVCLSELEHSCTQHVSLLDREHDASILEEPARYRSQPAPVAQWIEQRFPKPRAHVRFMPGASVHTGSRSLSVPRVSSTADAPVNELNGGASSAWRPRP